MTSAVLEQVGDSGDFRIRGALGFVTVTALYQEAQQMFRGHPELKVDLAGVDQSDSAGLALLVEWTREAAKLDQSLRFVNMPAQMLGIARVSGLEAVLPLAADS